MSIQPRPEGEAPLAEQQLWAEGEPTLLGAQAQELVRVIPEAGNWVKLTEQQHATYDHIMVRQLRIFRNGLASERVRFVIDVDVSYGAVARRAALVGAWRAAITDLQERAEHIPALAPGFERLQSQLEHAHERLIATGDIGSAQAH